MENDLQIKPRYKSSCTPHRVCLCVCCAVHMQKMSITVSRLQRIVNEANERYCQQHEFVISPFAQSASRLCNARMHLNPKSQHVVVILLPEQPPILRAFGILLLPARCRGWCRIRWFQRNNSRTAGMQLSATFLQIHEWTMNNDDADDVDNGHHRFGYHLFYSTCMSVCVSVYRCVHMRVSSCSCFWWDCGRNKDFVYFHLWI